MPEIDLPFWGRLVVLLVRFLPVPQWIKDSLPMIIGIIEALPVEEREKAKRELSTAVQQGRRTGNFSQLERVVKKCQGEHCE